MGEQGKVKALHRRLADERRRAIETMAESAILPAAGAMARLAELDGAIVAVEAVLDGEPMPEREPLRSGP